MEVLLVLEFAPQLESGWIMMDPGLHTHHLDTQEAEDVALLSDQCHGNWSCERGPGGLAPGVEWWEGGEVVAGRWRRNQTEVLDSLEG